MLVIGNWLGQTTTTIAGAMQNNQKDIEWLGKKRGYKTNLYIRGQDSWRQNYENNAKQNMLKR